MLSERDQFDEVAYLRLYPDIAQAVAEGREASGWLHYDRHGRKEGRKTNDFDADFYLRAYPAAAQEIAAGLAATPFAHYLNFGRARGFLSHAKAPRPEDAAAMPVAVRRAVARSAERRRPDRGQTGDRPTSPNGRPRSSRSG